MSCPICNGDNLRMAVSGSGLPLDMLDCRDCRLYFDPEDPTRLRWLEAWRGQGRAFSQVQAHGQLRNHLQAHQNQLGQQQASPGHLAQMQAHQAAIHQMCLQSAETERLRLEAKRELAQDMARAAPWWKFW